MEERARLLRAHEVAERLGVALSTVYAWAERGVLPAQRIRRCLRFDPVALARWLQTQPTTHRPMARPRATPERQNANAAAGGPRRSFGGRE